MIKAINPVDKLSRILSDPSVSFWLKDVVRTAWARDPVDALHDTEQLLELLRERADAAART